jgi:hypothetical protein
MPVDGTLSPELVELLTSASGENPNPALVMLIDQFGRMQQQMLEQFHQSMMLFLQHIGDHHQDQMRQVREEVNRLRELSDELGMLQERLQLAAPGAKQAALPPPRASIFRENGAGPPQPQASRDRPVPPRSRATSAASPPGADPSARASKGRGGHEDPLVMVSRRISEIRSEQRSRWQRILDMVRAR